MDNENSKKIIMNLESISKMLSFLILRDLETAKDKIIHLNKIGLSSTSVADILNITRNYVDVTLSNARKTGEL